jgi:predicted acylesterase/phospholipase RssA
MNARKDTNPTSNVVILKPSVKDIKWYSFYKSEEGIMAGYDAAREMINK